MQKFENTFWSGKCPVGKMCQWGNICLGKPPSGKCPVGELSWICQSGICPRRGVSWVTVQSGNCPTIYNTKINETEKKITDHNHDKYITTPELNELTAKNSAARLAQASLVTKSDIANFVNKRDFDDKLKNLIKKVTSNKIKHLLVENKLKKPQTFDSSLFTGQSYFNNDGAQLCLMF